MNAKKAKALRKMLRNAEKLAKPGQEVVDCAYYELEKRRKYIEVPDPSKKDELVPNADGTTGPAMKKVQIAVGQLVLAPQTSRGRYHILKKRLEGIDHKQIKP